MTPDQYRREGAEAMRASCVHAVNATASPIVGTPYSAGGRAFSDAIRAIDVDEVLARLPPATDAVARLWHAARLGLDMARANDLTNTAETIMEAMNAVECPCKGSDEMCPCQNRRTAPDAVARLVEAATVLGPWISASLSDPHTHAGEDYTRDADAFLVALAAMEASHDRT